MIRVNKKTIIKTAGVYAACVIATLCLFIVSIGAGYDKASLGQIISGLFGGDAVVDVLIRVNMPRTIVAFASGAALAVAGVCFQSVTRSKLADPAIIGVSSSTYVFGLIISIGFPLLLPFAPLFSALFGMAVFALVFWLSYERGIKPNRILSVGAAVNAVFVMIAITIAVMQNLAATNVLLSLTGSLAVPKLEVVTMTACLSAVGIAAAFALSGKCNVLALGDKTAQGLGVNVLRTKILIAAVGVFLTSVAAANVGITAFLGLLAPLIARKILGENHYNAIPSSAFIGGLILLSADCMGRALGTPVTLPVGIITTCVGGAVFITLLRRSFKNAD